VWPELWLTRGDPRLGKRPFIESIALSTYTAISPGTLLAYAIPKSSLLSCSSSNYTYPLAYRPLVARRFTIAILPSNRYLLISRITRQLPTARHSYLWVVSSRHLPLEAFRISRFDPLTAGPYPKGQGSPDRYDKHRGLLFQPLQPSSKAHSRFPKVSWISNNVDKPLSIKVTHHSMR